ncbi:efflux RND transporter periplasmic adaptor subunit [Rhodanobacter denitrificans]|uniref:RND family efflux transporter, MFP subunit n=1 Tax=Rhodanobacter denitrificans TaxID=666685 RepID=M4NF11_9GAMM|nr:efflux RND transporter periplasmic adaptor subunit [Rhodanobacter denitrificans]AGG89455.1 RND family efflux transporter, MFP subunit [Rhodanobacter denitrificans]UJM88335.1 efflux RND transporter periplasmic adaptor subunit [Rhodanobacter denitrificans]
MSVKHRRWIVAAVAVAAVVAVAWWALQSAPRPLDVVAVTRGPLVQRFEEEGRTQLPRRWVLTAPIAGTLRRIDLLQGDAVKAGQLVAVIEPLQGALLDPANRTRLLAEEQAAQASMQAAQQRLAAAQADAELAARDARRMRALGASGVVSVAALDEVEARLARARAAAAAAQAERRAAGQQRAALAALLLGQGRSGGQVVELRAPIDGVVLHRFQESAAPVQAGQSLLELGDLRQLEVMVQALSQQAIALRPGSSARILRWGGEGALPARVTRIEPGGFTKVSALGVEEQRTLVWLDITAPRAQWESLGDGYRVEVEFEVGRRPDVLQVPSSALFRDGRRWAVYRVAGGRARLTAVTPGMQGDGATEIVAGLRQGERVVAYPDDRIADGLRVRPLAASP